MSEPTKDRFQLTQNPLTEAHALRKRFGNATKDFALSNAALADLISFVRKQARDDALEGAKKKLESMQVIEENKIAVSRYQVEHDEIIDSCIAVLEALKDQPDGEA